MNAQEICDRVNAIFGSMFKEKRNTRGPDPYLRLYLVSWKDENGKNHSKMYKKKKTAYEFYNKMKAEHDGKAGIVKHPYDCYFIAEEGIEQMWKEYDIQDWTLEEFRNYVEYHKQF